MELSKQAYEALVALAWRVLEVERTTTYPVPGLADQARDALALVETVR
jgi:hypothetical protein